MDKAREDFIKYCLQTDRATLAEYAADRRLSATRSNAEAEEIELFLRYRPDLKAEEQAAPEKAKRGRRKAAQGGFDELADTKSQVDNRFGAIATPDQHERFTADLKNNTGEVWENRETWDLETWQKALGILRRMGIGDSLPY